MGKARDHKLEATMVNEVGNYWNRFFQAKFKFPSKSINYSRII